MKASVYRQYGSWDQLHLEDVAKPVVKRGEVLVKVKASSINSWDVDLLKGDTWLIRAMNGFFRPKHKILGADVAGVVEAVGENVQRLRVGDEVYGDIAEAHFGGLSEYVAVPEKLMASKPKNLSFAEAASLPQAGLLAIQGLRFHGDIHKDQKILINGAGGGVGTLALQYAKVIGAEVTCVDRKEKFEILHSLGADHIIDFTITDYTNTGKMYDKVLDVTAHRSTAAYKRSLKPDGVFAMIGGSMGGLLFRMMVIEPFLSRYRKKKLGIMPYQAGYRELEVITHLVEGGSLKPVVDSVFSLDQANEAFRKVMSGAFCGKVVIQNEK
ncbi:MAG TPA: NAD(P)-dependent alcohol dehydrogenase [Ohtaekwangia sp.]